LTKNNAQALRFDKIRVNGINMGWTLTPHEDQIQRVLAGENWLADAEARQPFGRLLRPSDIAGLVGYLLSDQAEMVTGSVIDFNQNVIGAWD
jgi:NAD(P)-dependent dehydrogenase (short-subunit alcohol dehydrogenase family)